MRASEFEIESDIIIGKGIEIKDILDMRVLVEKIILAPTKYPGKNKSGLRMQMQIVYATFNQTKDADGDYFQKDTKGVAIGDRVSCFTGSDCLMSEIQKMEAQLKDINSRITNGDKPKKLFPLDTTIVKIGKSFHFK